MENMFSVTKTSKILGVSRQTIYRWEKEGKIRPVLVNGFKKYKESEIKKMIQEG